MEEIMNLNDLSTKLKKMKSSMKKVKAETIRETAVTLNHNINTPLSSIILNTELLLRKNPDLDEDIKIGLKFIQKEVHRIHEIINRLTILKEPVVTEYFKDIKMVDLEKSKVMEKV